MDILSDLTQKIFNQEKMPEEWRRGLIIPINKGKGDIQECDNCRGIKLISHTMKIWEKIIEKRLRNEQQLGSALIPYLCDLVMDVLTQGIRDQSPWCIHFADDVIMCSTRRDAVEEKLEKWRTEMENMGLKISRKKTEYLRLRHGENGEFSLQ
ncbi:uncharacterized protein [Palaemon carinicauda]|uniref:uncharacterized protein n=1 Tax=Palaemon carinicauda TaxID=392227 RepID=UPI0035B5CA2D